MNINDYEMYVLSQRIRHKRQLKYINEVKTLVRMLYHFNKYLITEALAREFILKYADYGYDTETDDEYYHTHRHKLIGVCENSCRVSRMSLNGMPINWPKVKPGFTGWFETHPMLVSLMILPIISHSLSLWSLNFMCLPVLIRYIWLRQGYSFNESISSSLAIAILNPSFCLAAYLALRLAFISSLFIDFHILW